MNKIILVTMALTMGNLALADCNSESDKFRENFSTEDKRSMERHPEFPKQATRESMAEYDIKKAAWKKERELALENFKKESRRRSDECMKAERAAREVREKPRREEIEAIGARIDARQKEREASQPKQ